MTIKSFLKSALDLVFGDPGARGFTGEMARSDGAMVQYRQGKIQSDEEPAVQVFNDRSVLSDGPNGGELASQEFDEMGHILLSRKIRYPENVSQYYWRGEKLPAKPEVIQHDDGGRTITVVDPGDRNKVLYRRHEDRRGFLVGRDGEPAVQQFDEKGKMLRTERSVPTVKPPQPS